MKHFLHIARDGVLGAVRVHCMQQAQCAIRLRYLARRGSVPGVGVWKKLDGEEDEEEKEQEEDERMRKKGGDR